MIYLDNAATTKIHPEVLDAMMPYLQEEYGNAGTLYSLGRRAAEAVENARKQVANLIKAKPEQVVFTSGGSEANSMVFNGVKDYLNSIGKKHIVVSKIEHDSVLKAAKNLIKDGFHVTFFPVKADGTVDLTEFESFLLNNNDVGLVSIMHMNNEVGSENHISVIGEICNEHGVLYHADCVQSLGCCRINTESIMCDFLSMSSHKIHGPKGVGALYVKNKNEFRPLIHGGEVQEYGLRGGTENVPGIVGFGKACEILGSNITDIRIYIATIKQAFLERLCCRFVEAHKDVMEINAKPISTFGKVLNLRFKNIDGETLLLMLESNDIYVSAGSACRSHESLPSHVLLGIGLNTDEARDSIRVSFSTLNTYREVIEAADVIADCVLTLGGGINE